MPFVEKNGDKIHYALSGATNAPVIVFSNSLGANISMWNPQAADLEKKFRVLRYDTRGHGQSSVTPGPYSIEQLGRDVLTLLDALNVQRANFCGLSMGGMIGMWLGLNAPSRIETLVLSNTGAKIGSEKGWNSRIEMVRRDGLKAVAAGVIERWFTPEFRARSPQIWESALHMLEASPPEGYAANCAAVRDYDAREKITAIGAPAQVINEPLRAQDNARPVMDGGSRTRDLVD